MDYLNHENIARSNESIEYHPLKPFIPYGMKVLFLGSFPPPRKRWCMNFFYPNYLNDHWRIEGLLFYGDKNHFVDEEHKVFKLEDITTFLEEKGIGFYDTANAVHRQRGNASDDLLDIIEWSDIQQLLAESPTCKAVVTTGEKATQTLCEMFRIKEKPAVGTFVWLTADKNCILYRLPSSSRAYPMKLEKKAESYKKMFEQLGLL